VDDERFEVPVSVAGRELPAVLTAHQVPRPQGQQPDWRLELECDGQRWTGDGWHVFGALRGLMGAAEHDDVRIGVNGARPNAWTSGMLADMGQGRSVYLLPELWTAGRPPMAPTLGAAPMHEVGTVADQDAFQQRWHDSLDRGDPHDERRGDADMRAVLAAEQAETLARVDALSRSLDDIIAASETSNADDEHDPEGSTIAFERAQVAALLAQARAHLSEATEALQRLEAGAYGQCERCGAAIAPERLQARPTARTCIRCAAAGGR